jgi:molybdenum cofactor cytidylyltransferase
MTSNIAAIVLAAGRSRRMGQTKLDLPWGQTTVLGQVLATFSAASLEDILVVTGGDRRQVEQVVKKAAKASPVRTVHNPDYERGGMLSSIQTGLAGLTSGTDAVLIGLGDQPQVREETIRSICAAYVQKESALVIPSFQGHRGHPWLAARSLWPEILALPPTATPRDFLGSHSRQIEYILADESILKDLDTPEDYKRQRP